jgi:4'-phosphopantetheinyl transferase
MEIYWLEQNESDVPAGNEWLSSEEAICLHTMRFAKRRTDWRLGRWTAKHALAACLNLPTDSHALGGVEILAAASGAPEVFLDGRPADIAISLSHRAGTAFCTVGPLGISFGCDLEKVEPRSDAFVDDYFTAAEQALIGQASLHERPLLLALLWSAKESALKALQVGLRFDTRTMCVSPDDAWALSAEKPADPLGVVPRQDTDTDEWHPLCVRYTRTQLFRGWWRVQDDLVRTLVSDAPLQCPQHAGKFHGYGRAPSQFTLADRSSCIPG